MSSSSMNQYTSAPIALKKMNETPVSPLITTYVVDIGKAKISTFTSMRAEHIYVDPRTIKPSLRFVIASNLIVLVMVCCKV